MLLLSDIAWPLFLAKGLQSPWCATMKSRFDSLMSETASVRKGIGRFKLRFSSCLGWATHTGPHKTMIHFLRTSLDSRTHPRKLQYPLEITSLDQLGCIAYVAVAAPAHSSTKLILMRETNPRLTADKQE